ncbi:TerC family protein [Tautonia marina]|uniref:TerC family protein n=1 Tax=Tautonia marina TaxID=2653855 RepID=UPI0012606008|nr:TerC family protein [Tautonia marina]
MFEVLTTADWMTLGGTILTLIALEGLLSADNALVLAVMVRHLPREQQKKALRYGIIGAFIFRFIAVLLAAKILDYWQLEVIGGIYLLQLAVRHLLTGEEEPHYDDELSSADGQQAAPVLHDPAVPAGEAPPKRRRHRGGFWATVAGVEMADIAFSIDSILAAVAIADGMPEHLHDVEFGFFTLKTWVIYIGGVLGIITMRFVAGYFLLLLNRFKGLAVGAYLLVGWIGLKLIGSGFHHALYRGEERLTGGWKDQVPEWLAHNLEMPSWFFWSGMVLILVLSMVLSPRNAARED